MKSPNQLLSVALAVVAAAALTRTVAAQPNDPVAPDLIARSALLPDFLEDVALVPMPLLPVLPLPVFLVPVPGAAEVEEDMVAGVPLPALPAAEAKVEVAAEAEAEGVKAMLQEILPQLRQLLKNEMMLVDSVCRPTPDQRKRIQQAGARSQNEAGKAVAAAQQKMENGGWQPNMKFPDPRQMILEGLAAAVKKELSAEQAARYAAEIAKRQAHHKRVAIQNIIAKLDDELVLTAAQREKLAETLASNWHDGWTQLIEHYAGGNHYLPNLPDPVIKPVLNDVQKKIWSTAQKMDMASFGGMSWGSIIVEAGPDGAGPDGAVPAIVDAAAEAVEVKVEVKPEEKK